MRFALVTILSFVVLAVTKSQDLPLEGSSPYYPLYQQSFPQRNLINLVVSFTTKYSSTTTATSVTTCTVSVATACSGRRRRGIQWAEIEESIAPSAVSPVEATPVAELESTRTSREANPQFYGPHSYPAFFQPQQQYPLHPSIDGPYFYNYPGYQSYYQSGPYGPNPGHNGQKWIFNGFNLPSLNIPGITFTKVETVVGGITTTTSVSTVSSTPSCSTTGTLAACSSSG